MKKSKSRDYFAELYVAGLFGDHGWAVYFPKRDVGFDFMVSKEVDSNVLIRPVQVKGKYPGEDTKDRTVYGYIGALSQTHSEMVLAIPFFPTDRFGVSPTCVSFLPFWRISTQQSRGWACQPAALKDGAAVPRETFRRFFDLDGLKALESPTWSTPPEGAIQSEVSTPFARPSLTP